MSNSSFQVLSFPKWASVIFLMLNTFGLIVSIWLHVNWLFSMQNSAELYFDVMFAVAFLIAWSAPLYELFKCLRTKYDFRKNFDNLSINPLVMLLWQLLIGYFLLFLAIELVFDIEKIKLSEFVDSLVALAIFLSGVWYHSSAIKIHKLHESNQL